MNANLAYFPGVDVRFSSVTPLSHAARRPGLVTAAYASAIGAEMTRLALTENPDVLMSLSGAGQGRPRLVVGFAAETERVVEHARAKRARKGCDWILANDVSPATGTFGGDSNTVHCVTADGVEDWPRLTKVEVAERLAARIADHFARERAP